MEDWINSRTASPWKNAHARCKNAWSGRAWRTPDRPTRGARSIGTGLWIFPQRKRQLPEGVRQVARPTSAATYPGTRTPPACPSASLNGAGGTPRAATCNELIENVRIVSKRIAATFSRDINVTSLETCRPSRSNSGRMARIRRGLGPDISIADIVRGAKLGDDLVRRTRDLRADKTSISTVLVHNAARRPSRTRGSRPWKISRLNPASRRWPAAASMNCRSVANLSRTLFLSGRIVWSCRCHKGDRHAK